jgi:hypothetical protein
LGKYDDIEKREIRRDGATPVKNSGRSSTTNQKGDATMDDYWLVDYKYTEKSFTLSRAVWNKVTTDAQRNGGLAPTLKVIFEGDEDSTVRVWVISDEEMKHVRFHQWLGERLIAEERDKYLEFLEEYDNE